MRNTLPKKPWKVECGIINLDQDSGEGTHWVAYYKNGEYKEYFDSFGDLQPPREVKKYLGSSIFYNYSKYQSFNTVNCGHLAIKFLLNKNNL